MKACHLRYWSFIAILLSFQTMLYSQIPRDSICKLFDQASNQYKARKYASTITTAKIATRAFLKNGDTAMACSAMNLAGLASGEQPKQGIAIVDSAIVYYKSAFRDTSVIYFQLWTTKSRLLIDMGRYEESIKIQDQLDQMEPRLLKYDAYQGKVLIYNSRVQRAYIKEDMGLLEAAIEDYSKALVYGEKYKEIITLRIFADGHSKFSQCYRKADNLPKAEFHNRYALQLLYEIAEVTQQIVVSRLQYRGDYAVILMDAGNYQAALDTLWVVRAELQKSFPENLAKLAANDANLGSVLSRLDKLDEALQHTLAARTIFADGGEGAFQYTSKMDINLAGICRKQNRYEEGIRFARIAVDSLRNNKITNGGYYALAWKEAALCYLGLRMMDSVWINHANKCKEIEFLDSAIACINRAIGATYWSKEKANNILTNNFGSIFSQREFLQSMSIMGLIYERLYEGTNCIDFLVSATAYYTRAAQFIAYMDGTRLNSGATYFQWEKLWKDNYNIIESAIRCGFKLHKATGEMQHLRTALELSDMSKARQVSKNQLFFGDQMNGLVPKEVLEKEMLFLGTIDLNRAHIRDTNPDIAEQAAHEVAIWEGKMDSLKREIKKHYPRYYNLKYENQANFEFTQKTLETPIAQGDATLEYFVGNDTIYAFLQTADGLQLALIPHGKQIEETVEKFYKAIVGEAAYATIIPLGMELWQKLLPFPKLKSPLHNLLIIPDGFLYKLPFKALVCPDNGFDLCDSLSIPPYLYRYVNVAIDFSLASSHIATQSQTIKLPIECIQGLFPQASYFYLDKKNCEIIKLEPPKITQEMDAFANIRGYKIDSGREANSAALIAALQSRSFVQVTTHGFYPATDEADGYFILENSKGEAVEFHASELYGLPIFQNRMFVLNACEAGMGKYMKGEGPVSLARSFRQAGCPTILTNQWKAPAENNALILKAYYQGLISGYAAPKALRIAINQSFKNDTKVRHPKYWAGLTLYGIPDPILFQERTFFPTATILVLLLGALALLGIAKVARSKIAPI